MSGIPIPPVDGYLPDGTPVYTLEEAAKALGLPIELVRDLAAAEIDENPDTDLFVHGPALDTIQKPN